jgi:hypothetical protein
VAGGGGRGSDAEAGKGESEVSGEYFRGKGEEEAAEGRGMVGRLLRSRDSVCRTRSGHTFQCSQRKLVPYNYRVLIA